MTNEVRGGVEGSFVAAVRARAQQLTPLQLAAVLEAVQVCSLADKALLEVAERAVVAKYSQL